MKKQLLFFISIGIVLLMGCAKETSFETGGTPAEGSLQADGAGDCLPKTVNGIYEASKPLVGTDNTIVIQVNVLTPGSYDIRTDTVNGYSFRGTGIFSTTGINNVVLNGAGTPFTEGINNFVVSFDSTICDIQVTVVPAGTGGTIDWKFNDGATLHQGGFDDGILQVVSVPPFTLTTYTFMGSNAGGTEFTLILADLAGGINNGETFTTSSTTLNNAALLVTDASLNTLYEANASIAGLSFSVTVTSHNTSTKTVTGTFTGSVKDGTGNTKTLTNGTFTGTYP